MKTYSSHLKTTRSEGEELPTNYRPVFRSSAVFPVLIRKNFDTEITFLGYWFIKREIDEISVVLTYRSEHGEVLRVKSLLLNSVRSYVFSTKKELDSLMNGEENFTGSIELEIFSARDMVFPYPAITVAFKSELGTTFVHTCGRIYNDMSDFNETSDLKVSESGFDVIPSEGFNTFISFVNGPIRLVNQTLKLRFNNFEGETFEKELYLGDIVPYSTRYEFLFENEVEKLFFRGKKGSVTIDHTFEGFFPRLIVGNIFDDYRAMSLTHTFYDTSDHTDVDAYWDNPNIDDYCDSVISFPITPMSDYTELVVYPIHAPHNWNISLSFYTSSGDLIGSEKNVVAVTEENHKVHYIDANSILKRILHDNQFEGDISQEIVVCKAIVDGGGRTPARLKFGLNIGQNSNIDLPSNICFNATVPNKKLVSKSGTFKWCPIFLGENTSIPIINTSFLKTGNKNAKLEIDVWRATDSKSIKYAVEVFNNGCVDIMDGRLEEVEKFLDNQTGWVTIRSDNPFVLGFYITNRHEGVIGADHIY